MAWLGLGLLLLFLAVGATPGGVRSLDTISVAALAGLIGSLLRSFDVYAAEAVVLIAAGAVWVALLVRRKLALARVKRLIALAGGASSCLFALFGPADGLF